MNTEQQHEIFFDNKGNRLQNGTASFTLKLLHVGFLESSLYLQNPGLICNNLTPLLKWNTDELSLTFILQNLFRHISKAQLELDNVSLTWTGKTLEDSCSMRTAGHTAALVSTEGAWKAFKYRTSVLSRNTPEKNPIFASFTVTLSSKWVKYKRIGFHLHSQHSQINSKLQATSSACWWQRAKAQPYKESLSFDTGNKLQSCHHSHLKSSLQLGGFLWHRALQS